MRPQRASGKPFLGFIACGGWAAPITSVTLTGGAVVLTARRQGPVAAVAGPVTVYGEDRALIVHGGECEWPAVEAGQWLEVTVPVTFTVAEDMGMLALPAGG